MTEQAWLEELAALPDLEAQQAFLAAHPDLVDGRLPDALKALADRYLREDVGRSRRVAGLLVYLEVLTGNPFARALGLLAEANACGVGGLGEYQRAVSLYDEAAAIYHQHGRVVEEARSQIGKVYALAFLGRYGDALAAGEWAGQVLEAHGQHRLLAPLMLNLGLLRGRIGEDTRALAVFDRARELYLALGDEGRSFVPWVDHNRAIVLRNLGRFPEAIATSQASGAALAALGQTAEAARARQNLAITYFVLGRHNEALRLLDEVRDVFWADGRQRDAILVDLFISDCLLQLRRFGDVLNKCGQARARFHQLGSRFEVAQALLNEAAAYTGLRRYDDALASLAEARPIFQEEGNQVWVAATDLEMAAVLGHKGEARASLAAALACAGVFRAHCLPIKQAHATLAAARAALALPRTPSLPSDPVLSLGPCPFPRALSFGTRAGPGRDRGGTGVGRDTLAGRLASRALATGRAQDIPAITYQAYHLLGALARRRGRLPEAIGHYDYAIQELERLRGQLMVEFRVDFAEDKQAVYEDMVAACLDAGDADRALETAERSKSRAALELVAYHLDLGIRARSEADRPLVDELARLRAERDRTYRRWEGREEAREEDWETAERRRHETRAALLGLEQRITAGWHRLLVRNADYARDASLWQVRVEPIRPYLYPGAALIHYFVVHGELVALLAGGDGTAAVPLGPVGPLARLVQMVRLNLDSAAHRPPEQVAATAGNLLGLLRQLHNRLVAPLLDTLGGAVSQLIVVPHGPLHYLPFHALHDGTCYLLERHAVSYLPSGSFLRYCRRPESGTPEAHPEPAPGGLLAMGHSHGGRLPWAVHEARTIAAVTGGALALEEEATLACLEAAAAAGCQILHLAAHGEFRPDNPLFSGLALADGWLTTLDIFGLRLRAGLVTLSGCETGRGLATGGEELLGLMRAFLSAGAASLVLSQWTVDDRATAELMVAFYDGLAAGRPKGEALRHAQLRFLARGGPAAHPYFWAPFFLVGDTGPLSPDDPFSVTQGR